MWVALAADPDPNPTGLGSASNSTLSKSIQMFNSGSYTSTDDMGSNMGSNESPPAATTIYLPVGVVIVATIGQHRAASKLAVLVVHAAAAAAEEDKECSVYRHRN
jgi:hypothetical protein